MTIEMEANRICLILLQFDFSFSVALHECWKGERARKRREKLITHKISQSWLSSLLRSLRCKSRALSYLLFHPRSDWSGARRERDKVEWNNLDDTFSVIKPLILKAASSIRDWNLNTKQMLTITGDEQEKIFKLYLSLCSVVSSSKTDIFRIIAPLFLVVPVKLTAVFHWTFMVNCFAAIAALPVAGWIGRIWIEAIICWTFERHRYRCEQKKSERHQNKFLSWHVGALIYLVNWELE